MDHEGSAAERPTALPEDLESAVYDALLGDAAHGAEAEIDKLCRSHPDFEREVRELATRVRAGGEAAAETSLREEAPPPRIGRYTLGPELGRGGFGVVYRAQQDPPLARVVALKILAPGLDATAIHARFDAERQLLARLTHPNIARIHDAGTTDEGRPWFAMELIDGVPITRWAKTDEPDLRTLIEVFVAACEAVQHAHQQGVIHRDLKPGNVLVTTVEKAPVPKIIDFGVAKLLDPEASPEGERTLAGAVVGTPEYMSPEQARGENVDVRSDVYGLGALLYRLLVGEPPQGPEASTRGNLSALLQQISEGDVQRPSRQASQTRPDRAATLRGDLDWICLTALHRDPEQRYSSVAEFATDLRLHLEGRPIVARPPSFGYLAASAWRRHRSRLVLAAGALTLLVAATIASTYSWLEASKQEALATKRATELDQAYAELQRVTDPLRAGEQVRIADQELWPALPARMAELEEWLAQAAPLAARLQQTAPEAAEAARLTTAIRRVTERRDTAAGIAEQMAASAAAWERAAAELRDDPRFANLRLSPQAGFVPLGSDPDTGLQEFAHLLSGQVALREAGGRLARVAESGIVFVLVPGGTSQLGAQSSNADATHYDPDAALNETPVYEVDLDPFLVAKHEVTQGQWLRISGGARPSRWHDRMSFGGRQHSLLHPVEQVSWEEAVRVLGQVDLELPTEACWEHAARAGSGERLLGLSWTADSGENLADRSYGARTTAGARFDADFEDGYVVHAPVGSFQANAFGLFDILGNVHEWTSSRLLPYGTPAVPGRGRRTTTQIKGSQRGQRVFRGGSYETTRRIARVSRRSSAPKDARSAAIGVRPVRWLRGENDK